MPRFLQTPTLVVPFMPNNCMKSMESGSPVKHWYTGPVAMPPRTLPAAACPDHKPPPCPDGSKRARSGMEGRARIWRRLGRQGGGGRGENPPGRFHGSFCRHANSSVMPATSSVRHADSSAKGLFPERQAVEAVWRRVCPPGMTKESGGSASLPSDRGNGGKWCRHRAVFSSHSGECAYGGGVQVGSRADAVAAGVMPRVMRFCEGMTEE
jgi:hypothetical protein